MRSKLIPLYWLIGVTAAGLLGLSPNHYARRDPALHVYATETVLWVCGMMTVHALLLMAILRPASYDKSWGRALLAFLVTVGFFILAALGSMHSPPAWGAFSLWTLALFLFTFTLTLISSLQAFRDRKR